MCGSPKLMFCYVRVVDTDAPSYQGRTPQAVLGTVETEKRWKYLALIAACHDHWAGFIPLSAFLLMVYLAQRLVILCADLLMFCVGSPTGL